MTYLPEPSRQDTAGSGKSLKRQHSQKYHQKAPSISCGAHSGVKRGIFSVLAKAEGEPRDLRTADQYENASRLQNEALELSALSGPLNIDLSTE